MNDKHNYFLTYANQSDFAHFSNYEKFYLLTYVSDNQIFVFFS